VEKEIVMSELYSPPGAPKPEPVAKLTYGEYEFEISYTLMHWISGWLAHGMFAAHSVPASAKDNTRAAFERIRAAMKLEALRDNGINDLEALGQFVLPHPQTPKLRVTGEEK
jgi:hypothetical protein